MIFKSGVNGSRYSPLVVALLLAGPVSGQRMDTITKTDGSTVRGKVTRSFKQGIQVESGGREQNITANELEQVRFAEEPTAMKQAKEALAKGELEAASRALGRAGDAELTRDLVQQEFEFVTAELAAQMALRSGEGHGAAAKQMLGFLKAHGNTFHFYEAAESLGQLATAMGQFQAAEKYYAQLEKSPWPETQFKGSVLLAETLRAQGPDKLEEVLQRYNRIAEADVDGPEANRQKQIAILGRASVGAELGKGGSSVEEIEKIIADADPSDVELLGRAYNALGACYLAKQQHTDAILAYLHVDLLFAANQTAHAEALYHLNQLWSKVDKPDRGVDAGNRLKANYAGSVWAKK